MNETLIIIPSLNPDNKILTIVKNLQENGFQNILVVNDGSNKDTKHYFKTLEKDFACEIISYNTNRGKGSALKLAFAKALKKENIKNVITVDGDNQHKAKDVVAVYKKIKKGYITLGSRVFNNEVPLKSRVGNKVSSILFKYITKSNITDTQTGLRGFVKEDLEKIISIEGSRFEYEMNVLLNLNKLSLKIIEVPIETVYIENIERTQFRVIADTVKILSVIFKFLLSSLFCFVVDFIIFVILHYFLLTGSVFLPVLLARMVSSYLNYSINYKVVFQSNKKSKRVMFKYYLLILALMFLSSTFTTLFKGFGHIIVIKMIVDSTLFIFNYNMQRMFIFKEK